MYPAPSPSPTPSPPPSPNPPPPPPAGAPSPTGAPPPLEPLPLPDPLPHWTPHTRTQRRQGGQGRIDDITGAKDFALQLPWALLLVWSEIAWKVLQFWNAWPHLMSEERRNHSRGKLQNSSSLWAVFVKTSRETWDLGKDEKWDRSSLQSLLAFRLLYGCVRVKIVLLEILKLESSLGAHSICPRNAFSGRHRNAHLFFLQILCPRGPTHSDALCWSIWWAFSVILLMVLSEFFSFCESVLTQICRFEKQKLPLDGGAAWRWPSPWAPKCRLQKKSQKECALLTCLVCQMCPLSTSGWFAQCVPTCKRHCQMLSWGISWLYSVSSTAQNWSGLIAGLSDAPRTNGLSSGKSTATSNLVSASSPLCEHLNFISILFVRKQMFLHMRRVQIFCFSWMTQCHKQRDDKRRRVQIFCSCMQTRSIQKKNHVMKRIHVMRLETSRTPWQMPPKCFRFHVFNISITCCLGDLSSKYVLSKNKNDKNITIGWSTRKPNCPKRNVLTCLATCAALQCHQWHAASDMQNSTVALTAVPSPSSCCTHQHMWYLVTQHDSHFCETLRNVVEHQCAVEQVNAHSCHPVNRTQSTQAIRCAHE